MTTHTWAYRLDDIVSGPPSWSPTSTLATMCTYYLVYGSLVWSALPFPPLETKIPPFLYRYAWSWAWPIYFRMLPCELNLILPALPLHCSVTRTRTRTHDAGTRPGSPAQPGACGIPRTETAGCACPSKFPPFLPASRRSGPGLVGSSSRGQDILIPPPPTPPGPREGGQNGWICTTASPSLSSSHTAGPDVLL